MDELTLRLKFRATFFKNSRSNHIYLLSNLPRNKVDFNQFYGLTVLAKSCD